METSPELILPDDIKKTGLSALMDSLVISYGDKIRVLTLAPDSREIKSLVTGPGCPEGVRFVSQNYFGEIIRKTVGSDFIRFIVGALLVILILLIPLFRDLKKVLLSMVPVATGVIFMFGIMGLFNISFNIFNVISSILIIGLGIDYGIFMVCRCSEDYEHVTVRINNNHRIRRTCVCTAPGIVFHRTDCFTGDRRSHTFVNICDSGFIQVYEQEEKL